jgi:hypothetical protein
MRDVYIYWLSGTDWSYLPKTNYRKRRHPTVSHIVYIHGSMRNYENPSWGNHVVSRDAPFYVEVMAALLRGEARAVSVEGRE